MAQKGKPRGRSFQKGVSGNSAGRPPGSRNRATVIAETLLDDEAESLTRKLVQMALDGDSTAMRLCIERILPPRRERCVSFELPQLGIPADTPALISAIIAATANGQLMLSEATGLTKLVDGYCTAVELRELADRIEWLERTQNAGLFQDPAEAA